VLLVPAVGVAQSATRLSTTAGTRVLSLGTYIRALSGAPASGPLDYRLCIWAWDGHLGDGNRLLGQSPLHSIGQAAASVSNLVRVTWPLIAPVELGAFADVLVGVAWETDPDRQVLLGASTGTGLRYRKPLPAGASWPSSMKDALTNTDHDFVAWIDEWAPLSGVWVYRDGAWTQTDVGGILVKRDGFMEPASVKVRRSGVWVDAG
jgi:hypothetical protein